MGLEERNPKWGAFAEDPRGETHAVALKAFMFSSKGPDALEGSTLM